MVNIEHLIINILLIFCPLVFIHYLLKIEQKQLLYKACLLILFSIALISAMSFPVSINGLTYDLRIIPLTLGSLYGGAYVSLILYSIVILCRFLMSSPNQLIYLVSLVPTYLIFILVIRKYPTFRLFQKVAAAIISSLFIRMCSLVIYLCLIQNLSSFFNFITLFVISLQCVITGLFVLIIEYVKKNHYIQREIVNSEKMKIVSDIAASVAHEIRNPLTSIRGFIQLLGNSDLSNEKRENYKHICLEELNRAQQIISDYLSLAKPDPEKIEIIDIKDEITYISNILLSYANYQNVQVCIVVEEKNLYIMGDKNKFRQAVINIGKNAIEAMPNGGILKIEAAEINQYILLRVCDTGIGMTEHQITRLGTPYYSTKDKGTGLGTMVSFNIIKKMHGKIEIDSEIGKGTTFNISLPLVHGLNGLTPRQ